MNEYDNISDMTHRRDEQHNTRSVESQSCVVGDSNPF